MLASTTTRTLIVESQALFARALAQVLIMESTVEVVGEMDTVTDKGIRATRPDLLLIDIDGGKVDLTDAVQVSRRVYPNLKICALSMHLQPDVMQRCLNAGIDGYVVKDVTPTEFLRAIRTVTDGDTYVDPRIAGRLLKRGSGLERSGGSSYLSLREVEVVRLIVAGMSNKEISANLHLSEKTIKNHVSRIFTKFNCTARTQAAVFALRSGLV
jgi:two-component system, NarL family, response regulator DegU